MKPSLCISIPTEPYGSVLVHLAHWLLSLRRDVTDWAIDVQFVQAKPVAATRNQQVRDFLKGPADYLLTIDADAVPDTDTFRLLLEDILKPDVDAVGGWSFMVTPDGPSPVVQRYTEEGGCETHEEILSRPFGLYEITDGGVGAHCLMTSRETLLKIQKAKRIWFKDVFRDHSLERHQIEHLLRHYDGDPEGLYAELRNHLDREYPYKAMGERMVGQDTWFCKTCHDLGLRLWVDTRVCWGHVKASDIRAEYSEIMFARHEAMEAQKCAV